MTHGQISRTKILVRVSRTRNMDRQPSALHKILVLGRGNNNCDEDDNNDKCADKTENKTLFKELETGTHQLTIQNAEHQQPHLWDPTV